MNYYGQIDFTLLCRLWREQPELFTKVQFKDGEHTLLKVNLNERQQPDQHGNTHYLKANCKKSAQKEGVNYYVGGSFKPSENNSGRPATASVMQEPAQMEHGTSTDNLPF